MKISFVSAGTATGTGVAIAFTKSKFSAAATEYDAVSNGQVKKAAKAADFTGKSGSSFDVYAPDGASTKRLVVMGAGDRVKFDAEKFGAKAVKSLLMSGESTVTLHLDGMDLSPDDAARAALGGVLAAYRFDNYRTKLTKDQKPSITTLKIAYDTPAKARASYANFYGPIAEGTCLARDLVSEPPNKLNPESYAARIKAMAVPGLKIEVIGEKKLASMGMHAFVGVGLGSNYESKMVVMTWSGGKKGEKPACIIGKGVTFDAGGISLKPGAGMWDMKGDMGGSAAVVGAMHTIAARKAKANVIGIVGLVENMPDAGAQRPGDIVTSMSGQTIEVQNTDAEGRLVLCDVLHYARTKYKPKAMVNLATLTGAILVALGHEHAGLFSNNDDVAQQLLTASEESTEKLWRLPLHSVYDKLLDSKNADMKNIGGRLAGSITAAQFLQRFVGDTPWAHLDIAGAAWDPASADPRNPAWASGFGARLLNRWIADNYEG